MQNEQPPKRFVETLFERYTRHTDGKTQIAHAVESIVREPPRLLIDVGAGQCEIARQLAGWAARVIAIEPNAALLPTDLTGTNNSAMEIVNSRFEDVQGLPVADLVLASYFLDVVEESKWPTTLQRLEELGGSVNPIVCVTYLEGCEWDVFSQAVHGLYGTRRSGGFGRAVYRLRKIGWEAHILKIIDTNIFGRDMGELFKALEFFYKDAGERYSQDENFLLSRLSPLSRSGSTVSISLKEIMFEVFRRERQPSEKLIAK